MIKEATKIIPGSELHLTLLMAPQGLNLVTGQDREHLLAYGRAAFEAGQASKCLHQIAEPQKFSGDSEMRRAFEIEHGQNWEDPEWRQETGIWASAWHKATAAAALGKDKRDFPPMTPELASILGLMCFQCISFAQALRAAGHTIKTRAEDEQAAVLHWMLGHYFRHGDDWRAAAAQDMKRMEAEALAAQAKEGGAA
ncbi:hypothetical protein [Comamonas sp.]|uniref:hypothetical protein n=1 Tax=Comamonas sp. TaxID=34028 RepID=UPI0025891C9A|nr:hypothetical protein [Comamonas sp.]